MPYDTSLNSLIHEPTFINSILSPLVAKVNIVKKLGNIAAHEEIKDFLIKFSTIINRTILFLILVLFNFINGDSISTVLLFIFSLNKNIGSNL